MSERNEPLTVDVVGGRLVISIGVETLAFAAVHSEWANPWDDAANDYRRMIVVTDADLMAREVARALDDEQEDGTTPVHLLLDAAIIAACENGGEGFADAEEPAR
jgi:hypothetical protein